MKIKILIALVLSLLLAYFSLFVFGYTHPHSYFYALKRHYYIHERQPYVDALEEVEFVNNIWLAGMARLIAVDLVNNVDDFKHICPVVMDTIDMSLPNHALSVLEKKQQMLRSVISYLPDQERTLLEKALYYDYKINDIARIEHRLNVEFLGLKMHPDDQEMICLKWKSDFKQKFESETFEYLIAEYDELLDMIKSQQEEK